MEQTFAPSSRFEPAPSTTKAAVDARDPRAVLARRVFLGALAFNIALTLFWLWLFVSGGRTVFYTDYRLSLAGVAIFFVLSAVSHLILRRWHESAVKRER